MYLSFRGGTQSGLIIWWRMKTYLPLTLFLERAMMKGSNKKFISRKHSQKSEKICVCLSRAEGKLSCNIGVVSVQPEQQGYLTKSSIAKHSTSQDFDMNIRLRRLIQGEVVGFVMRFFSVSTSSNVHSSPKLPKLALTFSQTKREKQLITIKFLFKDHLWYYFKRGL